MTILWLIINMRVKLNLYSDTPILLSTSYNRALQGMIYNLLDYEHRDFLHNKGYLSNNRRFKLFTFSKLLGKYTLKGSYIIFNEHVSLLISSPIKEFIENICNNLLRKEIQIEINRVYIESIEFLREPPITNNTIIYTLSPIVVYSTLFTKDKRKKTYYYSPYEEEFSGLITKNLIKKLSILTNINMTKGDQLLRIEPLRVREHILSFKGTIIRGWSGRFKIYGSEELILTGYRCGLGSKNSAGFGMVEVLPTNA